MLLPNHTAPTSKKLTDPIWHQSYIPAGKCEATNVETDWNSKLESNCRRSSNTYVQEVNRAIYGDTTGHPPNDSTEYFQAAQNYAIYGKDFLDFPENLTPLLSVKGSSTPPEAVPFVSSYGNGLYPTPQAPETTTGIGFANLNVSKRYILFNRCLNSVGPLISEAIFGRILCRYSCLLSDV